MMTALRWSSGTVEALKWAALLAMVVDHVNAAFFARELGTVADVVGRIAFPLFAIVLGYNLARPGASRAATAKRLAIFGLLALPAHAYLFAAVGGWWPLNVLATFAVAVAVIAFAEARMYLVAVVVFVVFGAFVEYWWPGVALVVAAWAYTRHSGPLAAAAVLVGLLGVCVVNGNGWALLALPLLAMAARVDIPLRRHPSAFWVAYPAHLAAIAAAVYVYG